MQLNVEGIYAPINVFPKSGSGGIAKWELDNFEKLGIYNSSPKGKSKIVFLTRVGLGVAWVKVNYD